MIEQPADTIPTTATAIENDPNENSDAANIPINLMGCSFSHYHFDPIH